PTRCYPDPTFPRKVMLATTPLLLLLISAPVWADSPEHTKARQDIEARTVSVEPKAFTVQQLLDLLAKETGNRVLDQRHNKSKDTVKIGRGPLTFWRVLEEIAEQTGCGFSPYHEEGVVLLDAPLRKLPTSHQGIFRFAVKRLKL